MTWNCFVDLRKMHINCPHDCTWRQFLYNVCFILHKSPNNLLSIFGLIEKIMHHLWNIWFFSNVVQHWNFFFQCSTTLEFFFSMFYNIEFFFVNVVILYQFFFFFLVTHYLNFKAHWPLARRAVMPPFQIIIYSNSILDAQCCDNCQFR